MRRGDRAALAEALIEARDSTWALLDMLDPAQWQVPYRTTLNPPLWELGHIGWFQERWCLRPGATGALAPSLLPDADRWFDSSRVAHEDRWRLPLPPVPVLRDWLAEVMRASLARLAAASPDDAGLYFHRLALFHEQFHGEAFGYTWHALGYRQPGPRWSPPRPQAPATDLRLQGGDTTIGARPGSGFVFDNEKWAHAVRIEPFAIASRPVSNAEFLRFVEDGGYRQPAFWQPEAWARLAAQRREAPTDWRRTDAGWQVRWFDRWLPLEPDAPVVQVDAFEAQAWCAWADRRLPTEAEWELAATTLDAFEWGERVWEWTASPFVPYPGFAPDPYADYSQPSFGTHRVVRGGSFATPRSLVDPRLRNFYAPDRGDVFIGFRTCARSRP